MKDKPMTYWTLVGNKVENMVVVPLLRGKSINPIRKRHEARMVRSKKKNVQATT